MMKKIALINDLSGFGKCSLTAAIPVISVLGIQACPLPTAILSAQTGFEKYYYDDYTEKMDQFMDAWKSMGVSFEGIYSGFLAGPEQMKKVLRFLEFFQTEETLYLADPVMGDHGKKHGFFSQDFLQGMKQLTRRADVITPNLTELCLLADVEYADLIAYAGQQDYLARIQDICRKLETMGGRPQTVIVTGILRESEEGMHIGNLAVSGNEHCYVESRYTGKSFSGTGDLFASVICASLVKGLPVRTAMDKAVSFLQAAIEEASESDAVTAHGVPFEKYLACLL